MEENTFNVQTLSVKGLLEMGKNKKFVIPEYQRPYSWEEDEVHTLFDDIWHFSQEKGGSKRDASYFLGSIVSFDNDMHEQEIIDGQQRLTSLYLLLRAIYQKLESGDDRNSDESQNFIRKITPLIWNENALTGKVNRNDVLLTSRAVDNDRGNDIFRSILETGVAKQNAKDNYSQNYKSFLKWYEEKRSNTTWGQAIYDFIHALLNQVILLRINASSEESAFTIFSTLNDRGRQLDDADIFKAKIYGHFKSDTEKNSFIKEWGTLEREVMEAHLDVHENGLNKLFTYYMFYLRAKNQDKDTSTIAIRKYFLDKDRLFHDNLMNDLRTILNPWKVINANQNIENEDWDEDREIRKILDILSSYPNEFWKYPVVIYYYTYRNNLGFNETFSLFLKHLTVFLLKKYIDISTLSHIKGDVLNLDVEILKSPTPNFNFKVDMDDEQLKKGICVPHSKILEMLLKIYAYAHQDELLPNKWQVEHILPRKWQSNYFTENDDEVNKHLNHIGNLTPFEKKLNIQASNGYFGEKKRKWYDKSNIIVTKNLTNIESDNFKIEEIDKRDKEICTEIINILKEWER